MNKIEIKVLNPEAVTGARKMMACAARLTQRGHKIKDLDDFMALYNRDCSDTLIEHLSKLPHPTIQKFEAINVVVVGASRRFLAQITRHQNEVKFMSASLQYSDYSDEANFVVPYSMIGNESLTGAYLEECEASMASYKHFIDKYGVDNDSAGYLAPQGLRNVLIISATPYQWKHMISQRTCRRNTDETRYVMLEIWRELFALDHQLFGDCGPFCMNGDCKEGTMCCGKRMQAKTPAIAILEDYPRLF